MQRTVLGLMLAVAAGSAAAQDSRGYSGVVVDTNPKGYIGVGLGASQYKDLCEGIPSSFSCDDSGFAGKFYGGYFILPYIGVEGSYNNFGQGGIPAFLLNPPVGTVSLPSEGNIKTYAFALSLVGRIPLGPVSLMGRVGYAAVTARITGNAAVQNTTTGAVTYFDASSRDTTGQLFYGAGLGFNFHPAWVARLDWDRTKGEDGINPEYTVDMLSAGVAYRF